MPARWQVLNTTPLQPDDWLLERPRDLVAAWCRRHPDVCRLTFTASRPAAREIGVVHVRFWSRWELGARENLLATKLSWGRR